MSRQRQVSTEIDLCRDEPPTQDDLDKRAHDAGCPMCGSKSHSFGPRMWSCDNCYHEWDRELSPGWEESP